MLSATILKRACQQGLENLAEEEREHFFSSFKVGTKEAAAFNKAHAFPEPVEEEPPKKRARKAAPKKVKEESEEEADDGDEASEEDADGGDDDAKEADVDADDAKDGEEEEVRCDAST